MNKKASEWGPKGHRLQIYLSASVQEALDRYIAEKYSSGRVVTAIVTRALSELLEKEGYLKRQGGEDEVNKGTTSDQNM